MGAPGVGPKLHDEQVSGLKPGTGRGCIWKPRRRRGLELRKLKGVPVEKALELVPENGDSGGPVGRCEAEGARD